jgi:hypothetical protein
MAENCTVVVQKSDHFGRNGEEGRFRLKDTTTL